MRFSRSLLWLAPSLVLFTFGLANGQIPAGAVPLVGTPEQDAPPIGGKATARETIEAALDNQPRST